MNAITPPLDRKVEYFQHRPYCLPDIDHREQNYSVPYEFSRKPTSQLPPRPSGSVSALNPFSSGLEPITSPIRRENGIFWADDGASREPRILSHEEGYFYNVYNDYVVSPRSSARSSSTGFKRKSDPQVVRVTDDWAICNCRVCVDGCYRDNKPWGVAWKPKNEEPLPIVWMSDSHLLYSIALLDRTSRESRTPAIDRLGIPDFGALRRSLLIFEAGRRGMLPTEESLFLAAEKAMSEGVDLDQIGLVSLWALWDPRWSIGGGKINP